MGHRYRNLQIVSVIGGLAFYGLAILVSLGTGGSSVLTSLPRGSYGEGEIIYDLRVKGLAREEQQLTVPVTDRQYTAEEADRLFESLIPDLIKHILGSNPSLDEIRTDLLLDDKEGIPAGVRARWESDSSELVDDSGKIYNDALDERGVDTCMMLTLSAGRYEREYEFPIHIYPPELTEAEKLFRDFTSFLKNGERQGRTGEVFLLPQSFKDKPVTYRLEQQRDYKVIPIMGIICALLLSFKEKNDIKEARRKREQLLLLDYSELVSKLTVFIGAGMTTRLAWERICSDYRSSLEQHHRKARPAYEEMSKTAYQMACGTSESRAYGEFGKRCSLQPYLKLGALLEQGQKTGSKNLKPALELEMTAAFEERKNLAKRLGEEAGTKLLLPLFLMLGIVMTMIVVPAFLAFF